MVGKEIYVVVYSSGYVNESQVLHTTNTYLKAKALFREEVKRYFESWCDTHDLTFEDVVSMSLQEREAMEIYLYGEDDICWDAQYFGGDVYERIHIGKLVIE